MEGRERLRDGAGEEDREGRDGRSPFTNPRYATDCMQRTPDRGCGTADECRAMFQLPPA
jgi:hypothetical protein